MHMADALLSPAVAATMYAASGTTVGLSIKNLTKDENAQKLPTMAVASALVFAGQMINYTIPGTGSSGHMCGDGAWRQHMEHGLLRVFCGILPDLAADHEKQSV